MQRY